MRSALLHYLPGVLLTLTALTGPSAQAQLDDNCTVAVLNRTVRVQANGSWVIPNIPANFGRVKARATCVRSGATTFGESDYFSVTPNQSVDVPRISLGNTTQIPANLAISANPGLSLTPSTRTAQLTVTATYPNGSTANVTSSPGTTYVVSNTNLASVTPTGLVTALRSGTVLVQANNEGTQQIVQFSIVFTGDRDADGIPDDVETRLGLNPDDASDALLDLDNDGLSNLREYQAGTDVRLADTDGDGLSDGEEVLGTRGYVTNPLLADTDGDGIRDLLEIQTGTSPTSAASYNLSAAVTGIQVRPSTFSLVVNQVNPLAYTQLQVIGTLRDSTTIDLTSTARGTQYSSSDVSRCNFGSPDGRVFAGDVGSCTITVRVAGFTGQSVGGVRAFNPAALSRLDLPSNGFANSVTVRGNYAYVAHGAAGVVVVNVTDREHPVIARTVAVPGNANGIFIDSAGTFLYVATSSAGLQILNLTDPAAPTLAGAYNGNGVGDCRDVEVNNGIAYLACSGTGLTIVSVAVPTAPIFVNSVSLSGAVGLNVDTTRNIAAIARGGSGFSLVNIANTGAPQILSSVPGGDVRDLSISGNTLMLADMSRSMTSVDITNPATPQVLNSTQQSLGGLLMDVVTRGNLALGADVFFVNGVPVVDFSAPAGLSPRSIINFSNQSGVFNGRDDNGTSLAIDNSFVYLTASQGTYGVDNGGTGTTALYIGQYLSLEDTAGVPPTVSITAPANNSQQIRGGQLTVSANASDDVAISQVIFLVDNQVAFTDTTPPYEYSFTLPATGSGMNITARAVDYGNNTSNTSVNVSLIPDPLTTVTGRVLNSNNNPVANASVTTNSGLTGVTNALGIFTISGVPTINGPIVVNASFTENNVPRSGASQPRAAVPGGVTAVGDIVAVLAQFDTEYGTFVSGCDDCYFNYTLPFTFPYYGTNRTTAFVGTNGYITFSSGDSSYTENVPAFANQPRISAFFDDLIGRGASTGLWVKSAADRFVVTYDRSAHYSAGGSNTLQIILFPNGTIQFAYRGVTALQTGSITGLTNGPGNPSQQVHYTDNLAFAVPTSTTVYEYFTSTNPFNLDNGFLIFTPATAPGGLPGSSGYSVRVIPAAPPAPTGTISGVSDNGTNNVALANFGADLVVEEPSTAAAVRREVDLQAAARVDAAATTATVSPIANAEVEIRTSGQTLFKYNCNTDRNGAFSLRGLAPGGVDIRIVRRGEVIAVGSGIIPNQPGVVPSVTIRLVTPQPAKR